MTLIMDNDKLNVINVRVCVLPLGKSERLQKKYQESEGSQENEELPIFEQTVTNVTALVGQTVYLPCKVRDLGDKVVSNN
ncbi:hypothetical protein KQX54_003600 [Cotesia glomerata]|uniref:Uncharacterized protein n=1 Tax=Cotesia glomerata TaxID=32391 RepID=A0AAV7ICJ2_COTGL|nr:hypothetical protein KQX54_003600 [Cotesia glomerata]